MSGFDRVQTSAAVFVRGIDHRAELAALEMGEARDHAVGLSGLFLISAVGALLTGFAVNLLVAALWWDTPHRVLAISLSIGAQAAIAITAATLCVRRARLWRPLSQTLDQLKKDSQCLHELLTPPPR